MHKRTVNKDKNLTSDFFLRLCSAGWLLEGALLFLKVKVEGPELASLESAKSSESALEVGLGGDPRDLDAYAEKKSSKDARKGPLPL